MSKKTEDKMSSFVLLGKPFVEIKRIYPWIIVTGAFGAISVLIMLGVNKWDPFKGAPYIDMSSIWEVFFAVFGLMYAIIVGLFLVESFRRWGVLSSIIHSEINAIGDIHDCLRYLGNSGKNPTVKEDITKKLLDYVDLIEDDWNIMKAPEEKEKNKQREKRGFYTIIRDWFKTKRTGFYTIIRDWFKTKRTGHRITLFKGEGVRPIIEHVRKLKARGDIERHALGVIGDRVCEITTHRVNRLSLAEHGLTSGLYALIPFLSIVIWLATLLLQVGIDWVHGFIVFSVTVALISLFMLLLDLDHPFTGLFGIDEEMLEDLRKKLRKTR